MGCNLMDELTPREKEAARLAACGHTNKEVAEKMGLKDTSVTQYLHRAFEKLGVEKRTQLTYKATSLRGESLK